MAVSPHDLVIEAKAQIKEVSTTEGQALLGKRVVIDVREYDEFAAGHLPGAINIPRGVLEFKIGMVPECANKEGAFLIYCRTSGRAGPADVQGRGEDDPHQVGQEQQACRSQVQQPLKRRNKLAPDG